MNSSANMIVSTRLTTDFPFEFLDFWLLIQIDLEHDGVPIHVKRAKVVFLVRVNYRPSARRVGEYLSEKRSERGAQLRRVQWNFPGIWLLCYRLLRRARGDVDLDEHSWTGERGHDEKRASRLGCARVRLCTAFARFKEIADFGHIGDDFVDILLPSRAMLLQQPLDLVPGIAALCAEVAEMSYVATLSAVFILRSDAAQVDDLSRISHCDDLGKAPFAHSA